MTETEILEPPGEHQVSAGKVDVDGRLTRKQVADRLGVSIFKVRSMEGKTLHPEVVDGIHWFDPDDVAAVRGSVKRRPSRRVRDPRSEGDIAALVFQAITDGKDLLEIVDELRVPPAKVRELYRQWREPDLEAFELRRQKKEWLEAQRRREEQDDERHHREMVDLERMLAAHSK